MKFGDVVGKPFASGDLFLGVDEKGHELGLQTNRHAITIAGSRAGKGACVIIPNLLRWPHNVLCIDPKGENAENTYETREAMGHSVHVLDPFRSAEKVPDRIRASFNPLASINLKSSRARATISAIANGLIVVHDPAHMEWTSGARTLLAGVIAYVLADAPSKHHTFATVRQLLMQPNELPEDENGNLQGLYADAQEMAQDTRIGGLIRSAGITIMTAIESEKSMEKEFLGLARRSTEWLDDESIAACLNHSTFDLSELKTGEASVYLVLPADGDFLATYGAFLRLFVKASLSAMGEGQSGKRCLFFLDEFFSLGKMEDISEAAGRMPSYGVHLWPVLQDLGQLILLYGKEGAETFFGNADLHQFFGNTDPLTLNYMSEMTGIVGIDEIGAAPDAPIIAGGGQSMVAAAASHSSVSSTRAAGAVWGAMSSGLGQLASGIQQAEHQNKMNEYQQKMASHGRPRLSAEQIAQLVQRKNDDVADNLFCIMHGSDKLFVKPAPYFRKIVPTKELTKKEELAKKKASPALLAAIWGGLGVWHGSQMDSWSGMPPEEAVLALGGIGAAFGYVLGLVIRKFQDRRG